MRRTSIALFIGVVIGACVDVDFVEGVRCKSSEECGRALECEQGFCGGCSELGVLDNGKCGCPGDRIFDCRVLASAPQYCVEMCPTRRDRCAVALVLAQDELRTIFDCDELDEGSTDPCFEVVPGSSACTNGMDEIRVTAPDLTITAIVANCPPPDDDRLDCPPE
ncbi:MAG TPA: hypothetical protein VG755_28715 [Nannocystaceae bacterium]|nr:hypothetical protein [Nannocystaceae bacterium]